MRRARSFVRALLVLTTLYAVADIAYIVKSAVGVDVLGPQYGHHGWLFVGADYAIPHVRALLRGD